MYYNVFCDWKANKSNLKGRLVLLFFRLACLIRSNPILIVLFFWYLLFYRFFIEWILGIELSWNIKAGKDLILYHGQALVINGDTQIGNKCIIRHSTTIGNKQLTDGKYSLSPIIGDNVDIGSNTCIIGPITIGNNVIVGAGSVVVKNVPANCVIVGNPARIIKSL